MAENRVTKDEVSEKDVFQYIGDSATKNLVEVEKFNASLDEFAKKMKIIFKNTKPDSLSGINNMVTLSREMDKLQNDAIKTDKQKIVVTEQLVKTTKALTVEQQKQKEITRQANLESKQIARLKLAEKDSVEALRAKLALVTTAWTKLTKEEIENTKRGQRLNESKKQLTATIGTLEQKTGDHRRSVGDYGKALEGLKGKFSGLVNVAGQFGLALGGVALVRGAITTVAEFETQVADLSAVTGQTGKDLDFLKGKAIDFSKQYGESAASIAEAFKLAGSARPELLKNGAALADLTEKAIILSKASGDDVPTSIKNLTGTLNAFEMPASMASKVMDTLANAAQLGSQEIPYLTESFTKFGAIAKSQNISVAESAAAIEILGQKMPDAAAAGTGLRNVMLKLMAPDALGKDAQEKLKSLGINFASLSDKSKPFSSRLEALKPLLSDNAALVKVFGNENAVAAQILLSQTDQLKTFTAGLDKNGTAQDQAATKSQTLAEAGKRLKATIEGVALETLNGVGASEGMTSALDFLSKNMNSIISVGGKLIKLWVTYKVVQAGLKLRENAIEWNNNRKAIKDTGDALKDTSEGAKGFGSALKGIGMAVAIDLAIELGMKFWDVASGAEAARLQMALFNAEMEKGSKFGSEYVTKKDELMQSELKDLELRKVSTKMSDEMYLKERKNILENTALKIRTMRDLAVEDLRRKRDQMKALEAGYKAEKEKNPFLQNQEIISGYETLRASYLGVGKEIQEYNRFLKEMGSTVKDNTIAEIENTNAVVTAKKEKKKENEERKNSEKYIRKETQAIEDQQAVRDLMDPEKVREQLLIDEERALLGSDIAVIEKEIALAKAQQTGKNDEILKAEQELLKAKEDQIKMQLQLDLAQETNVNERTKLEKQAELDILNLHNKNVEENQEKLKEIFEKYGEEIIDGFIDRSKKREDILRKELDASKAQEDFLRELAINGNADASRSLAAQENVTKEKTRLAEKEAKKQAQLEELKVIYKSITDFMDDGDSLPVATVKGIAGGFGIRKLIAALPAFFKGTADTGNGGGLDGKGGFLSVLHPNERVVPKVLNQQLGGVENDELVNGFLKFRDMNNGLLVAEQPKKDSVSKVDPLRKEIQNLTNVVKNKKEMHFSTDVRMGIARGLVVTEKKGITRERTHYRP